MTENDLSSPLETPPAVTAQTSISQVGRATLQASLLRKMPANSTSQIRKMDLGEWSIYWALGGQSLEYYAGKYGVFYAHVDRFGAERRQECRVQDSAS